MAFVWLLDFYNTLLIAGFIALIVLIVLLFD